MKGHNEPVKKEDNKHEKNYYKLGSEIVFSAYNKAIFSDFIDLAKFELSINSSEENIKNSLENKYREGNILQTQCEIHIGNFRKGVFKAISSLSKKTGKEFSCQQNFKQEISLVPYCRFDVSENVRENEISQDIEQIKNEKLKQRNFFSEKNRELTKEIVRITNDNIYLNHTNEEKKEIIDEKIKLYFNFCIEQKKYYYSKSDIEFFKAEVKSAIDNTQREIIPEIIGSELHSSFNESLSKIIRDLFPGTFLSYEYYNSLHNDGNSFFGLTDHLPVLGSIGNDHN